MIFKMSRMMHFQLSSNQSYLYFTSRQQRTYHQLNPTVQRQQDSLHLDENILWQPSDLDTTPSGLGLAEEFSVELVESYEIVH